MGRGLCHTARKAKKTGELEAVGSQIHPRRPRRIQRPNPSALSDFSEDGVLLPAHIDDHHRQVGLVVALTIKVGRYRRFISSSVPDVEVVVFHTVVERLPGFSHILETTPSALY